MTKLKTKPHKIGKGGNPRPAKFRNFATSPTDGRLAAVLTEATIANGVTVERDLVDVRLRLRFPNKPSAAVRDLLKSRGFRWSPTQEAWQRQLTNNAEWTLRDMTPKLQEFYP